MPDTDMSNEVIHPMADNQQGLLLQCVFFLLRKPENSTSLQGFGSFLNSSLQSQIPVPPFLQRLMQEVAREDAQYTELWP